MLTLWSKSFPQTDKTFIMLRYFAILILATIVFSSCLKFEGQYTKLAPGYWRGELSLTPKNISPNIKGQPLPEKLNLKFDEVMEGQLPFIFEIKYTNDTSFYVEIINGKERIKVTDIRFGRDRKTAKDTLYMRFPEYESYIKAICEGGVMEGEFVITSKDNYRIPFTAKQGIDVRFTDLRKKPIMDISGAWETDFDLNTSEPYKAIGIFKQKDNELTGTFKTETGDFRYLEGTIQDKKLYLSCFDGAHAYLFEGKIQADQSIDGAFRSGLSEPSIWHAVKNANFKLTDPDKMTKASSTNAINFSFPDANGKLISLSDPNFKNKIKIIQIMGTWCPNCKDETIFLKDFIQKSDTSKIAVIALSFERHKDPTKAANAVAQYIKTMGVPYKILIAGNTDKSQASNKLAFLDQIKAYPTMLVLDKNNVIKKVHTGFSGPATDEFENFKIEFGTFIEALKKE